MNLRTRFALSTAAIVLAIAVIIGGGAYGIASSRLHDEIDSGLESRAARLVDLLARPAFRPGEIFGREVRDEILDTELDALTQLDIPGTGPIGRQGNPMIPTSDRDTRASEAGSGRVWSTFNHEDISYRVLTVAVPDGTLIRVAKDTALVDESLGAMRTWFPVLAALSAIVAAATGWLFARRVSAPIESLTSTAEQIASTRDIVDGITVSGNDEVARLGTSFNTMLAALRDSISRQRQLVQDASHELRTPLTSLRANTELLGRGDLVGADRDAILADMRAEIDELVDLSAELSALASDQKAQEEPATVDLAEVAADVAARSQRRSSAPVTLHVDSDTVVTARPHQLERALSNLVDNAIKFSRGTEPVEIHVGARRVEVRDHGPGIADVDKPHVFDRFYRAVSTRSMPGSGLGLAIVSQFADDHSASAYVLDNAGGGAIVGIQFPI
ncbi:MAG: HAMP domain-containing sensor histidine kinase [Ilumatobacteraceae bacterium]